jgi:hypothetical protein
LQVKASKSITICCSTHDNESTLMRKGKRLRHLLCCFFVPLKQINFFWDLHQWFSGSTTLSFVVLFIRSPILHTFWNAYALDFLIFDFDELSLLLIFCNMWLWGGH